MKIIICIFTIVILINSIRYSIYEIKNQNKIAGITVCLLGIFQLIFTNMTIFLFNV